MMQIDNSVLVFKKLDTFPDFVLSSFETLAMDQNMKSGDNYRFRAYSTGLIVSASASLNEEVEAFNQSYLLNHYQGGIDRKFPALEQKIAQYVIDEMMMKTLYPELPEADYKFGIHQIRIITTDEIMGKPAPEGIHQDGFDYVAVGCVAVHNITGGNSILVKNTQRDELCFDEILRPEEVVIFDDRHFAHYASPIVPKLPGRGARDVFVVTFERIK
ncbi:MAG: 2OG-Fe dioxygenase family protein [Francisellaceae bacterium]